jgi:poly(3-hydroxybutyrate) depolymerase
VLTVEGELDDISGAGQTRAAHDLCTGVPPEHQRHYEVKGAGHYGIFSGRRWRDSVYPEVKAFIAAHDKPQKRAGRPTVTAEDTIKAAAAPKKIKVAAAAKKPAVARKSAPVRRARGAAR